MTVDTQLEQATALIRAGRTPEAMRLLEENKSDTACQVRLREWYLGEGENDRAMPLVQRLADGFGAEAHVSRSIYALLGGELQTAVRECENALAFDPGLATAHNHLGRALHNLGRTGKALQAFREATQQQPDYPQAWQNLGHAMRANGQLHEALGAYRQALALAPGYRAAQLNLGITLSLVEDHLDALACFEAVLVDDPENAEALVNAGLSLHVLGRLSESGDHYHRAIATDPNNATAYCYLGILLNEKMDSDGAVQALEKAISLNPQDIEARVELAGVHEQNNRTGLARQAVDDGLNLDPSHPALKLESARLERRAGKIESAVRILRSINAQHLPPRLAQQFFFELGHALDRNGDYDEAFGAFSAGNELAARNPRRTAIDADGFEQRCAQMESWLQQGAPGAHHVVQEWVAQECDAQNPGSDSGADLCFMVGFPRSGTTLLDTMLDAHGAVASIEEKPTLEQVIEALRSKQGAYPACLEHIEDKELEPMRSLYRKLSAVHLGDTHAGLVIDKLPLRCLNAAFIHRLFPAARILFVLRHPCDAVLSNFMQSYAENEAFIHFDTLAESAQMYDRVLRLWQLCASKLPLNVHYIRYEDLVDNASEELERLCVFLGIELEPAMLDHHQRLQDRGRIRTTSYQQVAESLYSRASGRWLHYRQHLDPFLALLAPHIERYGYDAAAGERSRWRPDG